MKIADLKAHVDKLSRLLENPEPGLMTWHHAIGAAMDQLTAAWNGTALGKAVQHINGDPHDNRPENIRIVDLAENRGRG